LRFQGMLCLAAKLSDATSGAILSLRVQMAQTSVSTQTSPAPSKSSTPTLPVLFSIQTDAFRPATPPMLAQLATKRAPAAINIGVHCYGCEGTPYGCQMGLHVFIINPPPAFVAAGTQTLDVTVSDPRCDRLQLQIDTGQWQSSNDPVVVPELPVGPHTVSVRAICPGFPPAFSKPTNASWKVVDGRSTNT
jgi:hypothetical protein